MSFSVTNRFTKQYSKKDPKAQKMVDDTLDIIDSNPRHPGLHAHRVQGTKRVWECYIDDRMRVTFEYGDDCIILRNNCKHNITSKNP
jgi:hypothetical protein